jgi:hypothetical protein
MKNIEFTRDVLLPLVCILLAQFPMSPAQAEEELGHGEFTSTAPADTNPRPKGTAKRVVGNVLIPVSAVVGGLLLASGLMRSRCDEGSQSYSASGCRAQKNKEVLGALIAVAGISTGIYLKIDGNSERRTWNQWNDDHRKAGDDETRTYEAGFSVVIN